MSDPSRSTRDDDPAVSALRERVIARLGEDFAQNRLDDVELERRLELAVRARSAAELEALVPDLAPSAVPAPAPRPARPPAPREHARSGKVFWAILGGVARRGPWEVPRRMVAVAIMGGVELDLREAVLTSHVTEIRVFAFWGGVEVFVPPEVRVESEGLAIMGGFEDHYHTPVTPGPDAPVVRIGGLALMGAVEVRVRERGDEDDGKKR